MATAKLLTANMVLNNALTAAALEALKSGMDQADVLAAVAKLAELLENSDDE